MSFDVVCLILQAAGGGLAAVGVRTEDRRKVPTGTHVMLGGLALQVASLAMFMVLSFDYAIRYWRKHCAGKGLQAARILEDSDSEEDRHASPVQNFSFGLGLATLTIFVRCVFRVAELQGGFGGRLANDQILFVSYPPCLFRSSFLVSAGSASDNG